ncbi:MAG: adenosylcobinamide-GDP ribazoletransferase [Chloroflexota bacterium]|nr:adenosylcobinamide-GDP ribazoletransferase [Chloroflexota bacterium]MDE3101257.1 adenosylcobinamide-GDP ribazoletransferase [Chloroflexota bacterium]
MRSAFLAPGVALQLLTVVPLRLPAGVPSRAFAHAVAVFPVVGLVLGLAVGAVDAATERWLPASVAAGLDLALLAAVTGGLHLDGLADTADGLLGNMPRERRLDAMREPGIGAFGVIALVLVLIVEYAALAAIPPALRIAMLAAALAVSRWSMALILWRFPYARPSGVATAFRDGLRPAHAAVATIVTAVIAGALFGFTGVVFAAVGMALAAAVAWLAVRRLGGCTGDVYGAAGELTFAACLVVGTAIAR